MSYVVAGLEDRIDQALALGALQEALQLVQGALQLHPESGPIAYRHGLVLLQLNRPHEAFGSFTRAIRLDPLAVDVRVALARAYLGLNDSWSAAAWISDACRVAPTRPALWLELARMLAQQQRQAEVEPTLRLGLSANPQSHALREMLAELLLHARRYADGAAVYHDLVQQDPGPAVHHLHYGFCLEHTLRLEEAVQQYRAALALDGQFLEAHIDLAGVLWRLGDFAGSLRHAERAMAIDPQHPYAVRMLGTTCLQLGRMEEAEAHLRRALALQPDFPVATVDLALTLLLAGRFDEGWQVYQRRWSDRSRMTRPVFFDPELEWQGPVLQPLAGKRIMVYAEQGLGDVIHFIRYARVLQADGATVYCVIPTQLVPLVESIPDLVCLKPHLHLEADYHVALLELPLLYRSDVVQRSSSAPCEPRYLRAPMDRNDQWRDRLKPWAGKLKVGLAWAGHAVHPNHHNRSMALSQFKDIIQLAGVQCFSLQKSDGERYTDLGVEDSQLVDFTAEWADFSDSAALIENLDLVISIDSAVLHLAGALGKTVWAVLPPNPDWRWLLEREDSPWYPTMRLFRRGYAEPRSAQMARVRQALVELLAARR